MFKPSRTVLILLSFGLGCAASESGIEPKSAAEARAESSRKASAGQQESYRLQVGDEIDVKFYYAPELNETAVIRPDGRIALQLVGEISTAGLTPAELQSSLTEKFSSFLQRPQVAVLLRKLTPQRAYIGGEVATPGVVALHGPTTVLDAIVQTGGAKNTAEMASVIVLRRNGTSSPVFYRLDLKAHLSMEANEDIPLEPFDLVFVPKSYIARLNQIVEQYIEKLIPVDRSFGLYYNLGPNVIK